jgi:formylmethanofuran dehydrogenase subunit C
VSALTFALKGAAGAEATADIDCSGLTADALAGLSATDIAALPILVSGRRARVGDVFEVNGSDATQIVFKGTTARCHRIGAGATSGTIRVEGDAGDHLGLQLKGSEVSVTGSAGDFAACEMKRGLIVVHGNVGDCAGAPLPGNKRGMSGGMLVVHGNAGERLADQLRRGQILVAGNTGAYAASRMIAGTVVVLGTVGAHCGHNMRRGSLIVRQRPALPATFADCGTHTLAFLPLLMASWKKAGAPFSALPANPRAQRWVGDTGNGGKAEVLLWA